MDLDDGPAFPELADKSGDRYDFCGNHNGTRTVVCDRLEGHPGSCSWEYDERVDRMSKQIDTIYKLLSALQDMIPVPVGVRL